MVDLTAGKLVVHLVEPMDLRLVAQLVALKVLLKELLLAV